MGHPIPIKCPNCKTINNVNKDEPVSDEDDLVFDCGKCKVEVTVIFDITFDEGEDEESEDEDA